MRSVLRLLLSTLAMAVVVFSTPPLHAQRGDRNAPNWAGTPVIRSDAGYVFVDGVGIDAPYEISFEEQLLSINGQTYDEATFDLSPKVSPPAVGDRRGPGPRGSRGNGKMTPGRRLIRDFEVLNQGGVVILKSGRAPIIYVAEAVGHDLLEFLLAESTGAATPSALPDTIDQAMRQDWNRLAEAVQMTPTFIARATQQVQDLNLVRDKVEREFAAKRLGDRINYPLTMFAMVLVVFALGHLMAMAQSTFSPAAGAETAVETKRNITKSLVIVALLSTLDAHRSSKRVDAGVESHRRQTDQQSRAAIGIQSQSHSTCPRPVVLAQKRTPCQKSHLVVLPSAHAANSSLANLSFDVRLANLDRQA